jgi:hypothetical protein
MLIYGALIIPILISVYLLAFHRRKVTILEFLGMFVVALLCIVISKAVSEGVQVHDIEYWGHLGIGIVNDEPYSYESTCTREICSGSGKNRSCTTEFYTCIQDVGRHCYLVYPTRNEGGSGDKIIYETYPISYSKYKALDSRWKHNNHSYKHVHDDYYNRPNHGGQHKVYWDKKWETSEPMVEEHSYENKVQASDSVFNFPEVSKDDITRYGLYIYPDLSSAYESVTIMDMYKNWTADKYFRYINSELGPKKKLRIWVLIFKNQPQAAGQMQEALWKGGNKNEFIFCIGTDSDYNITWSQIISWTEVQELKIEARNFVSTQMKVISEESLMKLGSWSIENLDNGFVKKNWDDFNYLTVQPSTTAVIISYIITLVVCLGFAIFIVKNSLTEDNPLKFRSRRRRWRY